MPKTKATLIIPDNAGVCVYLSCPPPPICRAHATDCSLSLVNSSEKLHSEPRNNTDLEWKIKKKNRKKNSQKAAGCLSSGYSRWNRSNFARLICRHDPGLTLEFVVNPTEDYLNRSDTYLPSPQLSSAGILRWLVNPARTQSRFPVSFCRSCMRNGPDTPRFTSTNQSISSGNVISAPSI